MAYSVLNRPLDADPILSRFWKFVDARRSRSLNSLLGWCINLRNVTIVAVSADPRYGPMYNFGMADVIYRSLLANGYPKETGYVLAFAVSGIGLVVAALAACLIPTRGTEDVVRGESHPGLTAEGEAIVGAIAYVPEEPA